MRIALIALSCFLSLGCASAPWLDKIGNDYRLREAGKCEEPLNLKLAVAPVTMPPLPSAEESQNGASERFAVTGDPNLIREDIVEALNYSGIFDAVATLDLPQEDCRLEEAMKTAWEKDYDIILSLNVKSIEVFYDGVNGWYMPNVLNWLFLMIPSWWVKDEVYGSNMTCEMEIRSVRSGNLLYSKEFSVEFRRSLNDFQRGWQLFGIFRVPGSLGESNWRKVNKRLFPGLLHEIKVQTALSMQNDFLQAAREPDFEKKLETRLGLIIGISRYGDYDITKLKYAEEDAIAIHKHLAGNDETGIAKRNFMLLANEHATRKGMLDSLDRIKAKSRARDSIIIYFAGYGMKSSPEESGSGSDAELYLVPFDADSHNLQDTCIRLEDIEKRLEGINAREIALILDTSFGTDMESRSLSGNEGETPLLKELLRTPGRYALISGRIGEGAMEIDDHRHGVFTFYLLEGLKGAADADKDAAISLGELHEYLSGKVTEETQMEGSVQHPQLRGDNAAEMFLEGSR